VPEQVCLVNESGAVADGLTVNTKTIHQAFAARA
jgi:hypothetical protein